ncbi:hypothetical protein Gorai_015558 [Gossypium raimondii]|uniref:Uncharacterized protein n=1 Tax=Gossypium raimondii TaxID=29730 RepID=A0A7J8P6V1_GOSRA|nr:hypothetical protein [Gossypium raimondii]
MLLPEYLVESILLVLGAVTFSKTITLILYYLPPILQTHSQIFSLTHMIISFRICTSLEQGELESRLCHLLGAYQQQSQLLDMATIIVWLG